MSEEEETYVWRHEPVLSAAPIQRLYHNLVVNSKAPAGPEVSEKAVYLLEDDTYLYIRYIGMLEKPNTGFTDISNSKDLREIKELFDEY